MRRYLYALPLVLIAHFAVHAQTTQIIPRETIANTEIGWIRMHTVPGPRKPLKVDDKLYSPEQLSFGDAFATWMQASYLPKGGLGEIRLIVSEKLNAYSADEAGRPQMYGAAAKTYTELKYDAARKMVPATNGHLRWAITANGLEFGEPLMVLNTAADYYFLMPLFGEAVSPTAVDDDSKIRRQYDLSNHPALKRYTTYFNFQLYSSRYASSSNVLMFKDNKIPFVKITRAEYLDKLAAAIERSYAKEKDKETKSWPEGKTRTTALAAVDDRYRRRQGVLQNTRTKYQGRLEEPAAVSSLQPSVIIENSSDVFGDATNAAHMYPVYKVDPETAALAKTAGPQWVVVSWDGNIATDPVAKRLHDAILTNFDFGYLYDFVFDPEKVKGRPYKPLRDPAAK